MDFWIARRLIFAYYGRAPISERFKLFSQMDTTVGSLSSNIFCVPYQKRSWHCWRLHSLSVSSIKVRVVAITWPSWREQGLKKAPQAAQRRHGFCAISHVPALFCVLGQLYWKRRGVSIASLLLSVIVFQVFFESTNKDWPSTELTVSVLF